MKAFPLFLALLFVGQEPPRIEPPAGDLSGYYAVKGEGPDGHYQGVATVAKRGEVYVVVWTLGGGQGIVGVGLRSGDTLTVGWATQSAEGVARGVNRYTIGPGRRLSGRWAALPGPGLVYSETLEFLKDMED